MSLRQENVKWVDVSVAAPNRQFFDEDKISS